MRGNERVKALTLKQERFVQAMLTAPSIVEAAKACSVPESTARRWVKQSSVVDAIEEARQDIMEHAMGRLKQLSTKAVDALDRNLEAAAPPAVQVQAAKVVIEQDLINERFNRLAGYLNEIEAFFAEQGGVWRR